MHARWIVLRSLRANRAASEASRHLPKPPCVMLGQLVLQVWGSVHVCRIIDDALHGRIMATSQNTHTLPPYCALRVACVGKLLSASRALKAQTPRLG